MSGTGDGPRELLMAVVGRGSGGQSCYGYGDGYAGHPWMGTGAGDGRGRDTGRSKGEGI